MKNINTIFVIVIVILLATTIFFWQRSHNLFRRLALIQEKIEESKEALKPEKPSIYNAKAAIIIDDFGYNMDNLEDVWELDIPATISILPNLPYSKRIAKAADKRGLEIILHLPLEPHEHVRLEESTIMTAMSDEEIAHTLELAIASVPHLKGLSNHMGSKATEDERVMSLIFERMKEENLYFLDSVVTQKSSCGRLCRDIGIKFARRTVFLDNISDAGYIKGQIEELIEKSLAMGEAIGVGHDRELTIDVIEEMAPLFKKKGIEIVPVSELVR